MQLLGVVLSSGTLNAHIFWAQNNRLMGSGWYSLRVVLVVIIFCLTGRCESNISDQGEALEQEEPYELDGRHC